MAYAKTIMGTGFSAGQALGIGGGTTTGVSAAGTTQATATTLGPLAIVSVDTVGAASGVVLTAGAPGDMIVVFNGGANTLKVYPPSGAQFNALGNNNSFTLGITSAAECYCISGTKWVVNLSA